MASFSLGKTTVKPSGNPLLRIQSNTVSNQGQEGTCYAHAAARIFSRLIKVKFADLFNDVGTEECNQYYSKEYCDDNIFRCFEKEPKCSGDLDRDGMPIENISALLYVYLYKEVRNRYGCKGAQVTDSLQLLIDLFKNQTRILGRDNIIVTVLDDNAYQINKSPKREYLFKLIDRLVNIIMVVKRKVATDGIILNRTLPICTTRKCADGPVDYYPEVFNAMNITGYYSGLVLYGVTDASGPNQAHAVTISGFGFDAYNRSPQLIIKNSWGEARDWSNVIKDNKITIFDLPKEVTLYVTYVIFKSDEPRIQAAVYNARKEAEAAETIRRINNLTATKDKKATDDEDRKKADEDRKKADEETDEDASLRRFKDGLKKDEEDRKKADDRKKAQIALIPQWVGLLKSGTNAEKLTALQSLATLIEPLYTYEYIQTLLDSQGFEALINLANNGEPTAKENAKDMLFKMVDSSRKVGDSKEYYKTQKKIITEINRIDKGIILYIVNRLIEKLGGLFGIDDSQEDDLYQIKMLGFADEILGGRDKIEELRIIATENRTLIRAANWILPQIQDRDIAKNIELLRYLAESSDPHIKAAALGLLGDFAENPANIYTIAGVMEVVVRGLQCKEFIYGSCRDGRILGIARENAAKAIWNVLSHGNNADDDEEYRTTGLLNTILHAGAIHELVIALNNGGPKLDEYILGALAAITTSKIASKIIFRLKNAITKIFDKTSPNRKIEVQLNAIKVIHGLVQHEEYRFAIAAVGNFDDLTKLTASSNEEIKQIATETLVLLEPYNNLERLKSQARTMADDLFIEMFVYDIPKAHDIMYNILSEKPNLFINTAIIRYIVGKVNKARDKAPAMQVLVDKMGSDDIAIGLLSSGVSAKMLIQLARDCARPPPNATSTPAASSNRVRVLVLAVTALTKASPIGHGVEDIFIEQSDIEQLIDLAMTDQFNNAGEIIDIRPIAITALKRFLVEYEYGIFGPQPKQFIEFITTATSALVNKLASDATTDAKKLMAVNTLYNMVGPKSAAGPHPYNSKIPFAIANTKDCIPTLIRLLTSVNEEVKMAVVKLLFRLALENDKAFADAGAIRALTDALRAGQHNFKSWAAGVLGVISVKDDNIRKLVNDAGAIPLLITLAGSPDQTGADYNTFANGALIELAQNADIANAIRTAGYTITAAGGKTRKHQTHNQNKTNKKNKPNKTNKKTLPSKKSVSRKNRNGSRR